MIAHCIDCFGLVEIVKEYSLSDLSFSNYFRAGNHFISGVIILDLAFNCFRITKVLCLFLYGLNFLFTPPTETFLLV